MTAVMKVHSGVAAYSQHVRAAKADERTRTAAAEDGGERKSLRVEDFVSLSPQAQIKLTEDMLRTSIGKQLGAKFEELGIDLSKHVDEDQSVDAVSSRIVDFATGLFGAWRAQNKELSEDELRTSFEEKIRGAIDDGYEQAAKLLGGFDEYGEDTRKLGEATIAEVHRKLDDFFAELKKKASEGGEDTSSAEAGEVADADAEGIERSAAP